MVNERKKTETIWTEQRKQKHSQRIKRFLEDKEKRKIVNHVTFKFISILIKNTV